MPLLKLSFESGEASLDVRRFSVHEGMSSLFSASVWARSPNEGIDPEGIVGHKASLQITGGLAGEVLGATRCFSGICAHLEQQQAEVTGLSTYYLRIVPSLWLLSQRTNHRIFQRATVPDIADEVLAEWQIQPSWRIDRAAYPRLDYRVQYGESDLGFLDRMLEEAGISYFLLDEDGSESKLVLSDAPHLAEPRPGAPVTFVDSPTVITREYIQNVRFAQQVRPGKLTVRDHDFRRQPRYSLLKSVSAASSVEDRLEVYKYQPGSFLTLQKDAAASAATSGDGGGSTGGLWGEVKDELKDWRDEAIQKTDDKLTSLVGSKVQDALTKAVGKIGSNLAGSIMGEVMGGVLGEVAGDVGGKVVSDLLGGDRGPFSLDLEKLIREKVAATIEGRLDGAIDKISDFVDDKVTDKVGDLLDGAIGDKLADKVGGFVGDKANAMIDRVAGYAKDKLVGAIKGGGPGAGNAGSSGNDPQVGDDKGMVRHDEKAGLALATRALESVRADRRRISFDTSVVDLRPGTIFSVQDHPRSEISPKAKLLVTEFEVDGTPEGDWRMSGGATFADVPYRPVVKSPRPSITGLQSAIVVGPGSEEIYTDEHGRVRVQFHWDRAAPFNENSSLWMRVAQGWAGSGYGMITIPRVGTEVLVSFLEGDPDQPLVVGRVFSTTNPVPHKLPENKTVSTWRTATTPGGEGYNELLFDDAKGRELIYLKAERNLTKLVQRDETGVIQRSKQTTVGKDQTTLVMFNETLTVGKHRTLTVGTNFNEAVGKDHLVNVGGSRTENVAKNLNLSIGKSMAEKKKSEQGAASGQDGGEKKEDETGVYKMKIENKLEIEVGKAKITITKDGKVKIEGVEFDFSAEGHVQINGSKIELN